MVNSKRAEQTIITGVLARVSAYGFLRASESLLISKRSDNISWQLRFGSREDTATKSDLISVFAGIRFETIEAARIREPDDRNTPSISVPIHFLHEDRHLVEWKAESFESLELITREVEQYALPFFYRYENLRTILDALKSDDPRNWLAVARNERPELLAATLIALEMKDEARAALQEAIKERATKPPAHRAVLERMLKRL